MGQCSKRKNQFVWRIGNEEQALPRKSHKRLPRNWRIAKALLWREWPSSTSKIGWIVHDATEGSSNSESQDKANSLSDAREFHDPETAGSSGASHVTSPPLTNPSYRTVPRRDSGLPPETLNMMGISDVFERLPAREGQPQNISKNHGIWHLLLVEWNQNLQNIRWQQDRRGDLSNKTYPIRETFSTMEMEFHVILVELILTVVWWRTRDFQSRSCILQNSLTPWNLKAGKSISRLKFVRRQRILKSRCHGSQKLRKQSQLTNRVHRNQFLGEQISKIVKCWM